MGPTILRRLTTAGLRRGMAGNRIWLVLGITAAGVRAIQRMSRNDQMVLYRTVVKPGDAFEIFTKPKSS